MAKRDVIVNGITRTEKDKVQLLTTDSDFADFVETSDATATTDDIVEGKTAYVDGELITGGYTKPSGSITFTANGTYDVENKSQAVVNVSGGAELQSKSVTPSAVEQVISPDTGYDGLSSVTIAGDTDLIASNIKEGVDIFGVTGTFQGGGKTGNFYYLSDSASTGSMAFMQYGTIAPKLNYPNIYTQYTVTLDDNCEEIAESAFTSTYHVMSNLISNNNFANLKTIRTGAFNLLAYVSDYIFPEVTTIGNSVWAKATLTTLSLPKVTTISNSVLSYSKMGSGAFQFGSIGHGVNPIIGNGVFTGMTFTGTGTIYCSPSSADTLKANVYDRNYPTTATLVLKASETGVYGESTILAGDTILTVEPQA